MLLDSYEIIIHECQGRRAEAKACLEKCIQLNEAYPKAYDLLARIHRNLAVAYIEQANTFSNEGQKKAGYQTAEKLVSRAMDCDVRHQQATKLYRWLNDRIK